jgi:hypothetical protein
MLIEQQYAMMDSIGVEGRILRWGDAWEILEADTTRWAGISFASVTFSSIYPDSTMRRTLALPTELAPYVCPEQGRTGSGRRDEPQAAAQAGRKSDRWPAGWILSLTSIRVHLGGQVAWASTRTITKVRDPLHKRVNLAMFLAGIHEEAA